MGAAGPLRRPSRQPPRRHRTLQPPPTAAATPAAPTPHPAERLAHERRDLLVGQVHQQPVGEDDVVRPRGALERRHVGDGELNVGQVAVAAAALVVV